MLKVVTAAVFYGHILSLRFPIAFFIINNKYILCNLVLHNLYKSIRTQAISLEACFGHFFLK